MRDNPYFTAPFDEDYEEHVFNKQTCVLISPEEEARVKIIIHQTLSGQSQVFINGDWLPVSSISWDGTENGEVSNAFKLLAACECCNKHAVGKPINLQSGWVETSTSPQVDLDSAINPAKRVKREKKCSCDCRHRMRFMARQFN